MRTFGELKEDVAVLAQRSGDSDYKSKIATWLNLSHRFVYNIYDYWNETEDIHNFTTVASTGDYFMPTRFDKPLKIFDLTNNGKLSIVVEEDYFSANIANVADATETTAPKTARLYGNSPVTKQVSTAGDTLQAKSSSASDSSVVVRVQGYIDSALTVLAFENITVTGTTASTATSPLTFYKIVHVSKASDSIGYITLEDSSGVDLVLLAPIDRVSRHKILKLGLIPSQANSMRILFKRDVDKMVNDNDYPFKDMDEFLTLDAWGYALSQEKEELQRATTVWGKARDALEVMLSSANNRLGPDFQKKFVSQWSQAHQF